MTDTEMFYAGRSGRLTAVLTGIKRDLGIVRRFLDEGKVELAREWLDMAMKSAAEETARVDSENDARLERVANGARQIAIAAE